MKKSQKRNVTDEVKKIYAKAFKRKFPLESKFTPNKICLTCSANLFKFTKTQRILISTPCKWIIPETIGNCYFCNAVVSTCGRQGNASRHSYPNGTSVQPMKKRKVQKIGRKPSTAENKMDYEMITTAENMESDKMPTSSELPLDANLKKDPDFLPSSYFSSCDKKMSPKPLGRVEIAFIEKTLTKEKSETIVSLLRRHNCVENDIKITEMRKSGSEFEDFFTDTAFPVKEENFTYCNNIPALMNKVRALKSIFGVYSAIF